MRQPIHPRSEADTATIADLRQQVERLTAEVAAYREITACSMGVGDGTGSLFVHGTHASITAAQKLLLRATTAEAQLAAEREAVRVLGERVRSCEHMLACYRVGRRPSEIALDTARSTSDAVDANPIAAAAVKENA